MSNTTSGRIRNAILTLHLPRKTLSTGAITFALTALLIGAPATASAAPDQTLLDLINEQRAKVGCGPVAQNPQLVAATQRQADDLARGTAQGHIGSDGSKPTDRVRDAGYPMKGIVSAAEIVAEGGTQADLVNAWVHSTAGHYQVMVNCKFKETGVVTANNGDVLHGVAVFVPSVVPPPS